MGRAANTSRLADGRMRQKSRRLSKRLFHAPGEPPGRTVRWLPAAEPTRIGKWLFPTRTEYPPRLDCDHSFLRWSHSGPTQPGGARPQRPQHLATIREAKYSESIPTPLSSGGAPLVRASRLSGSQPTSVFLLSV